MKCSELFRLLKPEGWYAISQKGSQVKLIEKLIEQITILPISLL